MTDRAITWADLEGRPANTYQLTACPSCAHVLVRRLPKGTYHRNVADARAGAGVITTCPKCGAALTRRNLAN